MEPIHWILCIVAAIIVVAVYRNFRVALAIQRIKGGGKARLSVSEIVNAIINLPDAKNKLTQEQYNQIHALYNQFRQNKVKITMTMDVYSDIAVRIIKAFDLIAPYEKYCGGGEFEYSMLMEDIFGKNHLKVREIRRQIAQLELDLEERKVVDPKNVKILAEAYSDEQLQRMVRAGEFPAEKVDEYIQQRDLLESCVRNAPRMRELIGGMIEDLKKQLADLEK